jgi:hypothetical protein
MRYWISWYQPTEDWRPLKTGIPHWCTGFTGSTPTEYTICAIVDADNEDAAKTRILEDWPEAHNWRFCSPRPDDYMPPTDRFPQPKKEA